MYHLTSAFLLDTTRVFGVWFCFPFVLTMRKNALHHDLLSTWRQSPERATDRPASQEGTEECLPLLLRCVLLKEVGAIMLHVF